MRKYAVVAMQAKVTYNEAGDHDPYGLVYALASDEAAIRAGRNPDPLVLRANEGDCIEVTLTNKLTTALLAHRGAGGRRRPGPGETTATTRTMGLRVSMHPGMLQYDVRGSDGAAVGYNKDSTVGPGQVVHLPWFADDVTPGEIGAVNLTDFGDARGHRHHGLFAGLVVEPRGSTWTDPVTGRPLATGANADVRVPGRPDFRESVVQYSDGLNLRTAGGAIITDPVAHAPEPGDGPAALDPEDQGEKAFGYRNEPFRHRLGYEPVANAAPDGRAMADVYDSERHGDPATTMMRAYSGDELRVRVLQGSDKPRQHAFGLDGHGFRLQPDDPDGRTVGVASGITVGTAVNAQMGATGVPGDYLYGDQVGGFNRSGGLWGLLRVYPRPGGRRAAADGGARPGRPARRGPPAAAARARHGAGRRLPRPRRRRRARRRRGGRGRGDGVADRRREGGGTRAVRRRRAGVRRRLRRGPTAWPSPRPPGTPWRRRPPRPSPGATTPRRGSPWRCARRSTAGAGS